MRAGAQGQVLTGLPTAALIVLAVCMISQAASGGEKRRHPYLYFTSKELPALKAKLRAEPFASRWKRFISNANGYLSQPPTKGTLAGELGRSRPALGIVGTCSFAYAVTGDKRYGERAKREVFGLLATRPWHKNFGWNKGAHLATGETSLSCALFYDWCYDLMSDEERKTFREQLLDRGIRVYLSSVEKHNDWWVTNNVTNWNGVCHGGCGLGAMAICDESDEARRAVSHAWKHLGKFLREVNLADGGGHEGVMYHRYGMNFGHYFAAAAERFFGSDGGLYEDSTEKLSGYWDVYMQAPDMKYANFNDMNERTFTGLLGADRRQFEGGPNGVLAALMESKTKPGDPLLLWAADNGGSNFYWKGASPFWFLWRRAGKPPAKRKPPLQDAVFFRGAGHVILQSPALWMAYNGGWTSNKSHNNNDLGTFVLVAGGERFVHDPGYGKKETAEHSTVLVDGKGQPKNVRGEFLRFGSGRGFHYFASDLSRCYGGALGKFIRHGVMVDGRYVVLVDELTAGKPSHFEWRLQTRCRIDVTAGEGRAVVRGQKYDLHVVAGLPADAEVSKGRAAIEFVRVKPPRKAQAAVIVTALVPRVSGARAPEVGAEIRGGRLVIRVAPPPPVARMDEIIFAPAGACMLLKSVNGASAAKIGPPTKRNVKVIR